MIATTPFDSAGEEDEDNKPKREPTVENSRTTQTPVPPAPARFASKTLTHTAGPSRIKPQRQQPLFQPEMEQESGQAEEDEYGLMEFGDDDFAAIDLLSQHVPVVGSQAVRTLVPDSDIPSNTIDGEFEELSSPRTRTRNVSETICLVALPLTSITLPQDDWNLFPAD